MPWRRLGRLLFAITAVTDCAFSEDDPPADATVPTRAISTHYLREIQPIFDKHCVSCHGAEQPGSGLRLDSASAAGKGGATQRTILGGTLTTNEIYQRVTSGDPAYRMPKGGDPLSEQEIALIRRWVEEGCPVEDRPAVSAATPSVAGKPWWEAWFDRVDFLVGWLKKNPYATLFQYVGLALLIVIFIWQRFPRLALLRDGQQAMFCVLYLGAFLYFQQKGTADLERTRGDELQRQLNQMMELKRVQETPSFLERYGNPPKPTRLLHPNALARTYYRGNCERNASLFNHGNYCTNTFGVRLQSQSGQPLSYSDPVPSEGMSVRFEIARAPGSTPLLYKDDQMAHVCISSGVFDDAPKTQKNAFLTTIQSGERWGVDLPITDCPTNEGRLTRRFYVSNGGALSESRPEQSHYAFQLDLVVTDGKISADSDLWMGCLMVPAKVIPAEDSRIPFCEWFDWRPLPVIEGTNTSDLKLLGVLDHRPELEGKASPSGSDEVKFPPPPALPTGP